MAVPTVSFTDIATQDAAPNDAPYRVSRHPSKNDLDFSWEITFDGVLRYWQERLGGDTRLDGVRRRHLGVVCGLENLCGATGSIPLGAMATQTETDTYADIDDAMPTEGTYNFYADALNGDGWSG